MKQFTRLFRLQPTSILHNNRQLGDRLGLLNSNRTMSTDAKKALRSSLRTTLSGLGNDEVTKQSKTAQELVRSLQQYKDAKRISIYLSMPSGEAQTDGLVRHALESGKAVFVPYLASLPKAEGEKRAKKEMQMLRLRSREEYDGLERDSWGIPSLSSGEGRENVVDEGVGLDMIVVPGVAFDGEMNRMGHGAGFYDKFLTKFTGDGLRKKPYLAGFCLKEQIIPNGQITMESWDWKVDTVAVGDGKLRTSGDSQ